MTVISNQAQGRNGSAIAGPAYMLVGMLLIGCIDNFVVLIAEKTSLWQFHTFRSVLVLLILAALTAGGYARVRALNWWPVLARSLAMTITMLIYFGCLAVLPIGEVVAGLFTGPIMVLVISALFLGQRVGPVRWFSAFLGFAGILIIIGPRADGFTWLSLAPLGAAFFYAITALLTQHRCREEATTTILFWFYAAMGLSSAVMLVVLTVFPMDAPAGASGFAMRGWGEFDGLLLGLIVMQAFGSLLAVGLVTRAYQVGEATNVVIFEYSLMIFAPVWALIIWGQPVEPRVFLGAALIIISGAVIALRSQGQASHAS